MYIYNTVYHLRLTQTLCGQVDASSIWYGLNFHHLGRVVNSNASADSFHKVEGLSRFYHGRWRLTRVPPGRYELVFGPGALQDNGIQLMVAQLSQFVSIQPCQDALGNMAHSSKEFEESQATNVFVFQLLHFLDIEERGEWEHRVACVGDANDASRGEGIQPLKREQKVGAAVPVILFHAVGVLNHSLEP